MTKWVVVDEGEGYKVRAKRVDTEAYSIVIVEWQHPNYGYWADAGIWIKSLHSSEWVKHSDAEWFRKASPTEFTDKFPLFQQLFEDTPEGRLSSRLMRIGGKSLDLGRTQRL